MSLPPAHSAALPSATDLSDLADKRVRDAVELALSGAPIPQPEFAAQVPVPQARPDIEPEASVQVAALETDVPDDADAQDPQTATEALDSLLPQTVPVPDWRPERQVAQQAEQPAGRKSQQAKPTELAYAKPDDPVREQNESLFGSLFGGKKAQLPSRARGIAVYDIAAATVYMPDGRKLEAHSGLGHRQDDPRYVKEKMRGPTPPNVYNLVMREARFHGVEAVRLLPADGKKKYNRDGLLAHTYMYRHGDPSQSNGCVVFKNYPEFLKAFKRGEIKKMIVVPRLQELPTYMAAL